MMQRPRYDEVQDELRARPRNWLVTGCAGFIGSHLLEKLLLLNQTVVGLDNFSTGRRANLEEVKSIVSEQQWARFDFQEGDICHLEQCNAASHNISHVLHQAALGSVPRSIEDPLRTHTNNVDGMINMLEAGRRAKVRSFVYASSSSVYGDDPNLPKVESRIGSPLSPYAASKRICEIYAEVYHKIYKLPACGLRYFNVFGARQDPLGAYAAVIPRWFRARLAGDEIIINGEGNTSRDFCFVENVVQANILASIGMEKQDSAIYNVACGESISLVALQQMIDSICSKRHSAPEKSIVRFGPERNGDIRHSLANIDAIQSAFGYQPLRNVGSGLEECYAWYEKNYTKRQ